MTEPADLERLGIGVQADPKPIRLPGEEPRRRRAHVLAWLFIAACVVGIGASVALLLITPPPAK